MGLLTKLFDNRYVFKDLYVKTNAVSDGKGSIFIKIAICRKVDDAYVHVAKGVAYPEPPEEPQSVDEAYEMHPLVPWLHEHFENFVDARDNHYLSKRTLIRLERDINQALSEIKYSVEDCIQI